MKLINKLLKAIKNLKVKFWLWKKGIIDLTPIVGYSQDGMCIVYGRYFNYYIDDEGINFEILIEAFDSEDKSWCIYRGALTNSFILNKITEKELQNWREIKNGK